jgi:alpha-methylacyl-CoA racemase
MQSSARCFLALIAIDGMYVCFAGAQEQITKKSLLLKAQLRQFNPVMLSHQFLQDIKVLDLSQYIPGPFATRQLADLGANVLKIEPPNGDPMRHFMSSSADCVAPVYKHLNRGKRICRIDLKSTSGKQSLTSLLQSADVLMESFRPGVLSRLGFDRNILSEINPSLIHCALSGYGQTGPYRLRAGHDLNYCAASGAVAVSGISDRPVISFPPIADHAGAMQASTAILAALHARHRSGEGSYLDISLFETSLSWQYLTLSQQSEVRAEGLINGGAACYNIYQSKDGLFLSLGALESQFWARFCQAIGQKNWIERQFEPMPQKDLITDLSTLFSQKPRNYWDNLFESVDCCYQPVLLPAEVHQHAQVKCRQSLKKSGPSYPGLINDEVVAVSQNFIELPEDVTPTWG